MLINSIKASSLAILSGLILSGCSNGHYMNNGPSSHGYNQANFGNPYIGNSAYGFHSSNSAGGCFTSCFGVQQMPMMSMPVMSAPVMTTPVMSTPVMTMAQPVMSMPAQCPAGTTPSNDGTCLQVETQSYSTYTVPTYSAPAVSMSVDCPAGTTPSNDGTCLQGSVQIFNSTQTVTSSPVQCPAGTTMSHDGTCLQGSATIYSEPSISYPTEIYQNPTNYIPVRK